MNEKGMMEYDIVIAVVLFLAAYVVTMRTSIYPMIRTERRTDPYEPGNDLMEQIIIRTPGEPRDWSSMDEVQTLGLSHHDKGNSPNILDIDKLEAINGMDCGILEDKIPVDTSIEIRVESGEGTHECFEEGWTPDRKKQSTIYVWNGTHYVEGRATIKVW